MKTDSIELLSFEDSEKEEKTEKEEKEEKEEREEKEEKIHTELLSFASRKSLLKSRTIQTTKSFFIHHLEITTPPPQQVFLFS
ncbi:MAG: hypothetical protein ACI94Y_002882 [Maribacter sp.]|jgi:hypothetical protein